MKGLLLVLTLFLISATAFSQTEGARISGRVTDVGGSVIAGARCTITDIDTNISASTATNEDGIYVISGLHPAMYQLTIEKDGFRTVVQPSLELYAQDAANENFMLALGPRMETITVEDNIPLLQTQSASVSTVVNQQFVDNMPLNGRSFQSLISVAPGIVFTSTQNDGPGQFSVNGQRSDANYFTVDGVSANFGVQIGQLSQSLGGAIPAFTSQGGTNGFVSVDDMQEFRIQTSSYEAEFGRTPGAQISIVTKSGGNSFHGTAFDYLRNDIFDARNYFDSPPLPKPPLRQNDFGGTFGGPIIKDKTFFFFSYEGLRLRLPQTASSQFYTASARAVVAPVYQPFINALPLPDPNAPLIDPTCDNITNPCQANIVAAYSDPSSIDAVSFRIDHKLTKKINLFARYSHAPSYDATRNWEEVEYSKVGMDTFTAGATILLTPAMLNDFRANWSKGSASNTYTLTNFHGAVVPPPATLFPPTSPYSPDLGQALVFFPDGGQEVRQGKQYGNSEQQLNFVDTLSWAFRTHLFKFGLDYRRLIPAGKQDNGYSFFPSAFALLRAGTLDTAFLSAGDPFSVRVNNYSLFAQDTWKITNQLTLTYGLRWEINTPPVSATSQPLYATQGIFDANPLAVVPGALWHTRYNNFAPRIGAAYQVTPKTVARAAFGVFYDLGYGSVGDASGIFPYQRSSFVSLSSPVPLDLTNPVFQPPPFSTTIGKNVLYLVAVDPNLRLPLILQWNAAIQRELGKNETLSATYVGADDMRLLREDYIRPPLLVSIGNGGSVYAIRNAGYSHYNALQVQFQRRMSHGLQALISYNLAKTSDLGSSDTSGLDAASVNQLVLPPLTPSDFDIRNSTAGAISYELPAPSWGRISNAILRGWAVDGLVRVSSAPPINITVRVISPTVGAYRTQAQVVPGQPFWIPDSTQPGGTALNPAAFTTPAAGQVGDFPRNSLRSPYSIDQTDVAVRRRFKLTENLNLSVRAEYFNLFNHPMFGAPGSPEPGNEFDTTFGKIGPGSTTNLLLGGGAALGGQSPLYALGGPRSAQFTIKLQF